MAETRFPVMLHREYAASFPLIRDLSGPHTRTGEMAGNDLIGAPCPVPHRNTYSGLLYEFRRESSIPKSNSFANFIVK